MQSNRLLEKMRDGRTSLGLYVNSPDMVDLCGHLGFDWFMIDQMFSANDWSRTEELMRAGEAAGITPVVRIQSNPWAGYDHRIAVDVTRALGIGIQFVLVSNSSKREIDECLEVSKVWQRKGLTIHPYSSLEDWDRVQHEHMERTYVIPQPETEQGIADLEDCIRDPRIKAVLIPMTDASRVLTGQHRPDWYDERLWSYVRRAVELGREHDVVIGANTSYAYSMEEMKKRVRYLHENGIRMILVQGAPFLFQVAMTEFLSDLRPVLG